MREIKFRAWNEHVKDMVYSEPMPDMGFWKYVAYDNTTPFMQYTGLKDKNGVEIYEGDILATANDGSGGADTWEREVLGSVYWNDSFACWNHRADLNDDDSIYNLKKYVEVIGNIYENPELIDGKE